LSCKRAPAEAVTHQAARPGKIALEHSAFFLLISSETLHGLLTLCLCRRPNLGAVIHQSGLQGSECKFATTDFPFQKVYLASLGPRRHVGLLALRWTGRSFACSEYQLRRFVYRNTEANG
jgi:hypothetical protein